jgi:hypothetical protein
MIALLLLATLVAQAPVPQPSPSAALPEIGRVRTVSNACAIMHELGIPSFAAALRGDARFVETSKELSHYLDVIDNPALRTSMYRQSLIEQLASDAGRLQQEALVLNDALGDARLAGRTDPQVAAERAALQELYDTQQARAKALAEFVTIQRLVTYENGMEDPGAFIAKITPAMIHPNEVLPGRPLPPTKTVAGMPLFSGRPMNDQESIRDWTTSLQKAARDGENQAAKTLLPIAQGCK